MNNNPNDRLMQDAGDAAPASSGPELDSISKLSYWARTSFSGASHLGNCADVLRLQSLGINAYFAGLKPQIMESVEKTSAVPSGYHVSTTAIYKRQFEDAVCSGQFQSIREAALQKGCLVRLATEERGTDKSQYLKLEIKRLGMTVA